MTPDRPVAHGVHPAVKGVKPARAHQAIDRRAGDAGAQQLPPRDHAVLPTSDLGGDWSDFSSHIDVKSFHAARVALSAVRNNTHM
jgi:hypothetical protein